MATKRGRKRKNEMYFGPEEEEAARLEAMLTEWLSREDDSDEIFLQQLEDATLGIWDHYTHLRIAWLFLTKYGRREGLTKIFDSIKSFIERSPRTKRSDVSRGTTFHETMTYFWTHMVLHYHTV
jgi:ADP-ribosylation factor protein 1